jgi:hypothetical protein
VGERRDRQSDDGLVRGPDAPRRAFLTTAVISLSGMVLNGTVGCSERDTAPNQSEISSMAALRTVDPKLLTYAQIALLAIPATINELRGVTVLGNGDVWVAGDQQAVRLAGKDFAPLPPLCVDVKHRATCVAAHHDGGILVGTDNGIVHIGGNGAIAATWAPPSDHPWITSIAPFSHGAWVADWQTRKVYRYGDDGSIHLVIGAKDENTGYPGIIAPSPHLDIATNAAGQLFVANPGMHRVETFSPSGQFLSSWGRPDSDLDAFCGCCNPTDIALLPDGKFATSEKGIPRVKISDSSGQVTDVVAGPDQLNSNAMGLDLAVTENGTVLMLDPQNKNVRVYARRSHEAAIFEKGRATA